MRPCCRGRRLRAVSQALGVSRAQLSVHVHRKPGWRDGRQHRQRDDSALLARIMGALAELLPMVIGESGRCYDVSQRPNDCPSSTPSGYIASCAIMACCWKENRRFPWLSRHIRGVSPLTRAIDAGARMALSFAAIMAKNSGSRSPWTAVTGKPWTGPPAPGLRQ